jgi:ABC-type phosphate transport system permease subunit
MTNGIKYIIVGFFAICGVVALISGIGYILFHLPAWVGQSILAAIFILGFVVPICYITGRDILDD